MSHSPLEPVRVVSRRPFARVFAGVAVWMLALGVALALSGCATVITKAKGIPPNADADAVAEDSGSASTDGSDADAEEITELFVSVFDGSDPDFTAKLERVFNVDDVADVLVQVMQANADIFAVLSAIVLDVEMTDDDRATVTFDLLVEDEPTLQGASGDAVLEGGEWKIDAQLMCDLVALADSTVPCVPATLP